MYFNPEDGDSISIRNVGIYQPVQKELQARRPMRYEAVQAHIDFRSRTRVVDMFEIQYLHPHIRRKRTGKKGITVIYSPEANLTMVVTVIKSKCVTTLRKSYIDI